jgi:NADPH:quinone reductase-like Zn-dependent oxidoreductase
MMAVSQLFPGPPAASPLAPAQRFRQAGSSTTPAALLDRYAPTATMTAVRIAQFGPPEIMSVGTVDVPEPGELEILVRVCAAGVGPWDALIRTGKSGLPIALPLTPGAEISGVVEKVGANVAGFAPGDEVFGATNPLFIGGYAAYAVASARMMTKKSPALSHVEAAAMPVVGVTAWQMLFDHAALRESQTVIVHGAAGNVGVCAVQLARWRKLNVIATVRNGDAGYVRSLGADEIVNTDTGHLADFARRADAVIDTVGGAAHSQLLALLKPGGILVSSVSRPSKLLAQQKPVRADYFIVDVNSAQLARLAQMCADRQFTVPVGSVLPLAEARAAHEMLAGTRAHNRGKIVLRVGA